MVKPSLQPDAGRGQRIRRLADPGDPAPGFWACGRSRSPRAGLRPVQSEIEDGLSRGHDGELDADAARSRGAHAPAATTTARAENSPRRAVRRTPLRSSATAAPASGRGSRRRPRPPSATSAACARSASGDPPSTWWTAVSCVVEAEGPADTTSLRAQRLETDAASSERSRRLRPRRGRGRATQSARPDSGRAVRSSSRHAVAGGLRHAHEPLVRIVEPEDPGGAVARAAVVAELELFEQHDRAAEPASARAVAAPTIPAPTTTMSASRLMPRILRARRGSASSPRSRRTARPRATAPGRPG